MKHLIIVITATAVAMALAHVTPAKIVTARNAPDASVVFSIQDSRLPAMKLADSHGHKHGSHGDISIEGPFARATVSKARNGAAYFTINNDGNQSDRLIQVKTSIAQRAELHTHVKDGDVMKMRQIEAVDVPANGTAVLKPGGHHVMLMGLKSPLKKGEEFPLTLVFEKAGEVMITVKIGKLAAKDSGHGKHAGHGKMDHGQVGKLVVPVHRISAAGVGGPIGTIVLKDTAKGLMVMPDLRGLTPGGHGFHIHANGNCRPSVKDGKLVAGLTAGPHYSHGAHGGHQGKPADDLQELVASADGTATTAVTSAHLNIHEIAGRSIMIHAESEAAGSGARIACGVIPKMR